MINNALLNKCARELRKIADALAVATASRPEPEPEPEPEPVKPMAYKSANEWFMSLGPPSTEAERIQRANEDVRAGRSLSDRMPPQQVRWPRSPEQARSIGSQWWFWS
jgi:hypothetical protein